MRVMRVGLLVFFLLIGLPVIAREADDAAAAKEASRSIGDTLCPDFVQSLRFCTEEELQGLKECQWGEDPVSKQCGLGEGQTEVTVPAGFVPEMRCGKKKDKIVRCKSSVAQTLRLDAETCQPISFEICCNEPIDICRIPTEEHYIPPPPPVPEPKCGDGKKDVSRGETCEPPGSWANIWNRCREDCTFCGDGQLDEGEECDDGNDDDNDRCGNDCRKQYFPPLFPPSPTPPPAPKSGRPLWGASIFGGKDMDPGAAWGESLRSNPQPPVDPSIGFTVDAIQGVTLTGGYQRDSFSIAAGPVLVKKPDVDAWWLDPPDFVPYDHTLTARVKGGRKGLVLDLTSPTPFRAEDLRFIYSLMVIEDQDVSVCWREGASRPCLELHRDELWSVGFGPGYQVTDRVMVYGQIMYTFTEYTAGFNGEPDPNALVTSGLAPHGEDHQLLVRLGMQFSPRRSIHNRFTF